MSTLESCMITNPLNKSDECAKFTIDNTMKPFVMSDIMNAGQEYTFSMWMRSDDVGEVVIEGATCPSTSSWQQYIIRFVASTAELVLHFTQNGTYYIYKPQLEIGSVATDYEPAPEDLDQSIEEMRASFEQTANGLRMDISKTQTDLSTSTNELQNQLNTINKYFTFDINGMTIGQSDSPYKVVIDNDEMVFSVNGVDSLFVTPDGVYAPDIGVSKRLNILGYTIEEAADGKVNCDYTGATIPLTIVRQPVDQTITFGETAEFTIKARGDGVKYQWQYGMNGGGTYLVNANNNTTYESTYRFRPTDDSITEQKIRCIVTDRHDNRLVSEEVILHVNQKSSGGDSDTMMYTVTNDLINVVSDNDATSVAANEPYAAVLTPDEGYVLSSVIVAMGGEDVTTDSYDYNVDTGAVNIPSVTGDVVITAIAQYGFIAPDYEEYDVSVDFEGDVLDGNVTLSNNAVTVTHNSPYVTAINVAEGYTIDAVAVFVGNANVTDTVYSEGVIDIPSVTGPVNILIVISKVSE